MNDNIEVYLNAEADAYGFLNGDAIVGAESHHSVNVMPPRKYWTGQMELEGYEPHDADWVLFLDGEEVGRVREPDSIETVLARTLINR